jgi:hypothetical protein
MSGINNKSSRRDFVKTIGGVLGGISLLGHGIAGGQALGSIPNRYKFYRILADNEGGTFNALVNVLGDISGSVMMASPRSGTGVGYVYVHGVTNPKVDAPASPGVFMVVVDFTPTPPVIMRVIPIAVEGRVLRRKNVTVGHIGTGASNALGEYVTTILPAEKSESISVDNSPGVYLFRPSSDIVGDWSRIIGFADPVPDGSFYGGDFGDVALDDDGNLLLAAATTQSPASKLSGFAGSQALIATSIAAPTRGRVVLQTGDMLPSSSAAIESIGLIDLAANQTFAAQVTAKLLDPAVTRSGTALVVGNTQMESLDQKLVAASPELMSLKTAGLRDVTSGQTFFGPRVDLRQNVAFVTHVDAFQESIGSNDVEVLSYYSKGSSHPLQRTQPYTKGDGVKVIGLGAPCIDRTGLMYGTKILSDGTTQLLVSDGDNSHVILQTGDLVEGRAPTEKLQVTEILFGQHSTQVDAFGRLAFTAEFLLKPSDQLNPKNVITALVIGIPE